LQLFPSESLAAAIRNVFDFDAFSADTLATIREVFGKRGITIGTN
jgi:hypothetical protein